MDLDDFDIWFSPIFDRVKKTPDRGSLDRRLTKGKTKLTVKVSGLCIKTFGIFSENGHMPRAFILRVMVHPSLYNKHINVEQSTVQTILI